MSTGLQSSSEITINLDDAPGGTPVPIHSLVLTMGGTKVEVKNTPHTAFGDAWERHKRTGIRSMPPIPIGGKLDTETLHAILAAAVEVVDPNEDTQTFTVGYGDGIGFTAEVIVTDLELKGADGGGLTEFTATMLPTGEGGFTSS
jgi:hypothetical protein